VPSGTIPDQLDAPLIIREAVLPRETRAVGAVKRPEIETEEPKVMDLPKGLQQMRNIPMFPLIPLVPIGVMASVILLEILNLRALKRLEKEMHSTK
jgi:hypothetical protein